MWWLLALLSGWLALLATGSVYAQDASAKTPEPVILTEQHDDWTWRCVVTDSSEVDKKAPPACEIAHSVRVEQEGSVVELLNLAVSRADDRAGKVKWALIVLTPLDVHLTSDFGLSAGNGKPATARFRNCNHLGCFVVMPLDQSLLTRFRRASDGAAFFRLMNGKVAKVIFSLKGFSRAFDDLSSGRLPDSSTSNKGGEVK